MPPQLATATEPEWHEIDAVLSRIAALSKADIPFSDFASELLDQTVAILAAEGGGVWLADEQGALQPVCQINSDLLNGAATTTRRRVLQKAFDGGEAQVFPPPAGQNGDASAGTELPYTLLIHPLSAGRRPTGLLEIVQRPSLSPDVLRGNWRFLGLVCELAADYLRRGELAELRSAAQRSAQLEDFVEQVHRPLALRASAYLVANEGRRLIGCDRVSVAIRKGRRYRLLAISGVDRLERRSNAVRRLETLAAVIGRGGEPVWYDGDTSELAPEIADALERYLDEAHARTLGVIPVTAEPADNGKRGEVFAVLIVEQFAATLDTQSRRWAAAVGRHGGVALLNALRYESLPTLPLMRQGASAPRGASRGWRAVLAAVLALGVLAALVLKPADFHVRVQGKLQPELRQEVFAPLDGQVIDLAVEHGRQVVAGDTLLELRSPQLDLEIQRVQGEYETTRKRLLVVESTLLQSGISNERSPERAGQLAAEQEELVQLLASQEGQLRLLREERQKLLVRSPIAGQVLTWDLEQLLRDRPVQRGQALLSVADPSGPWVAEVDVPDDRIGFVLNAQQQSAHPLNASFQLATDRRGTYPAVVRRVAARTELDEQSRPVVKGVLDFNKSGVTELRPGATIFAKIHCGRRPLGYVWFHDLIEYVRGWLDF